VINCAGFDERILIDGAAYVNSSASGSILLEGGDLSLTATGGLFSPNPSGAVDAQRWFGPINYTPPSLLSGGSMSDPYAGLTPPAVPAPGPGGPSENITRSMTLPAGDYGQVSINGSNISVTLNPGDFAGLSTIGNNVNVTLDPGSYVFSGPVSFDAQGGKVALSPGAYLQGLHIWGADLQVTLGSGTYVLGADQDSGFGNGVAIEDTGINDSIDGTSGVLLYVSSGSVNFIGFGQSLTLSPESASPPAPIVLWQAATDTDAINVLGIGVGVAAVGGTIYAPNAVLGSFGAGNSYSLGGLVAGGISCPGFGYQLTITG
jgi:hypothetical protein